MFTSEGGNFSLVFLTTFTIFQPHAKHCTKICEYKNNIASPKELKFHFLIHNMLLKTTQWGGKKKLLSEKAE